MAIVTSFLATVITFGFMMSVLRQYRQRRRAYQLVWSLALLAFAVAFLAQFVATAAGWNALLFRLWYGFGALYAVPLLGLGSIFLLCPRWAKIAAAYITVLLMAWGFLRIYSPDAAISNFTIVAGSTHPNTRQLPQDIRFSAIFLNSIGTLVLFAGAAWSAWTFRRRRTAPHRVVSNLLIAGGASLAGAAGGLERLGYPSLLFLGNLLGITVIYIGFLRSNERFLWRSLLRPAASPGRPQTAV